MMVKSKATFFQVLVSFSSSLEEEGKKQTHYLLRSQIFRVSIFFCFHPSGYSVAAQGRKLIHEKITYLNKFGISALDLFFFNHTYLFRDTS